MLGIVGPFACSQNFGLSRTRTSAPMQCLRSEAGEAIKGENVRPPRNGEVSGTHQRHCSL